MSVKENSRVVKSVKELPPGTKGFNEADTNAESGVAGANMILLSFTSRSAHVYGFLASNGAVKDVPIVMTATAYICLNTRQTYLLLCKE